MTDPESTNRRALHRFTQSRLALASTAVLILICLIVFIVPAFYPHSPTEVSPAASQPPSTTHWFGTDLHGRDLFARVCYGTRISILVGLAGASVSLLIGVLWGATAGFVGGRWDGVMMRIVDILDSLPSIIFVIVLIATLEGALASALQNIEWEWLQTLLRNQAGIVRLLFLFAGLGAVSWLTMARIVRGQVLTLKTRSFIEATRALGASEFRIVFRHILPNLTGIVLVYVTLTIPSIILYESFLSYLGLGIQPPHASLGSLIAEGAAQLNPLRTQSWLLLFPAGTLTLALLALTFAGDALRDAFDPRAGD